MDTSSGTRIPTGRSMADEAVRRGAIDLAQGVMHAAPPPVLLSLLKEEIEKPRAHIYTSPYGVEAYRDAIVRLLQEEHPNTPLAREHVLGTHGVTGGLLAALISQLRPGDNVILTEPFYPAHAWAIRAARGVPVFVKSQGDFSPDFDHLRSILPSARAMVIANPANPSGYVWSEASLCELIEFAAAHDFLLIIDEIYRDYIWDGAYANSLNLSASLENIVVLRGFSKTLAISGWRAGYAVSAPEHIEAMTGVHDALYVGAPSLPQWVLARALTEHRAELDTFVREARNLYGRNRSELADIFRAREMTPYLPAGAFYMLVTHHCESDLAATEELLAAGVAVAPGVPFFAPGPSSTGYIRAHFAVPVATLSEIRRRLAMTAERIVPVPTKATGAQKARGSA